MKKGLEWEVIPERREAVEREVELYNESVKNTGDTSKQVGDRGKPTEHGEEKGLFGLFLQEVFPL